MVMDKVTIYPKELTPVDCYRLFCEVYSHMKQREDKVENDKSGKN